METCKGYGAKEGNCHTPLIHRICRPIWCGDCLKAFWKFIEAKTQARKEALGLKPGEIELKMFQQVS